MVWVKIIALLLKLLLQVYLPHVTLCKGTHCWLPVFQWTKTAVWVKVLRLFYPTVHPRHPPYRDALRGCRWQQTWTWIVNKLQAFSTHVVVFLMRTGSLSLNPFVPLKEGIRLGKRHHDRSKTKWQLVTVWCICEKAIQRWNHRSVAVLATNKHRLLRPLTPQWHRHIFNYPSTAYKADVPQRILTYSSKPTPQGKPKLSSKCRSMAITVSTLNRWANIS